MKSRLLIPTLFLFAACSPKQEAITEEPYQPTWESLSQWECPEWFKDAKFGIWAHWGPQCQPEDGDWYARNMYYPGTNQYNYHIEHYGDPSEYGLKEIIRDWKAENWNPEELIELYKSVGARYFMTLANHHDNMDLYNSKYQPEWNSVNIGPKRDIVGEWLEACRKANLPTGVSVHAAHAWSWLEGSQNFDGNLSREDGYTPNADGSEKWWKGLDPQGLYAQRHTPSRNFSDVDSLKWDWEDGCSIPDSTYMAKLMNRTIQLVEDYKPDILYFDDTVFPFYGITDDWGLEFLAKYYNQSARENNGVANVVVTGKVMPDSIKRAMMWDVERGVPDRIQEEYWQTCTCIGEWHYSKKRYDEGRYKSAKRVIQMLVDVISKNGNLLLSVPLRADGTLDEKELKILNDIKKWMDVNSESIYGTRPWIVFGEGPIAESINPLKAQGFNEGQKYSAEDVRYVTKNGDIYATILEWPQNTDFTFKSIVPGDSKNIGGISNVNLLGYGDIPFSLTDEGLKITLPDTPTNDIAPVIKIMLKEN